MLRFLIILAAVAVYDVQSANRYFLYTRDNQRVPVNISTTDEALSELFKPEENTIILVHGHGGSSSARFNLLIREQIFEFRDEHNVIVVDWEREASQSYSVAVSYVSTVADDLARFLRWLVSITSSNENEIITTSPLGEQRTNTDVNVLSKVHLVGFDLGAHVAGIASRQLRDSLGVVQRITGLDPSGSQWGSNSQRLRDTDADYVEVIHTDGSGLLANGIGTNIGQVNFHANGGSNQPGCLSHSCSHDRAFELFAASIRGGDRLVGNACSSNVQMNLNLCRGSRLDLGGTSLSKPSYSSIYRVNTGRTFPF